jgi:hypothetical protein
MVLHVLRFTDSYYPFGIFKLFLKVIYTNVNKSVKDIRRIGD